MNFNHAMSWAIRLGGCVLLLLASSLSLAQNSAGKTIMAKGEVTASSSEKDTRALARRSPVFIVDNVTTGQKSAAQLRMIDGGLLSLQQQTELAIADYDFDQNTQQGHVDMSLLKGGLRTITGALQASPDTYRLKTPIASIGVRGTHYEAELADGDLYLAGWEGIIDVSVDATGNQFSLGPDQDYRFAIVRQDGTVQFLVNPPTQFTLGHSNDLFDIPAGERSDETRLAFITPISAPVLDPTVSSGAEEADILGETFIDNDQLVARVLPPETGVSRTGTATFDHLSDASFTSSNGSVSDLNMAMTVNFDTASVPTGSLSFTDSQGEWFAAFNGLISANDLDLNINFASHNNQLADGNISGFFTEDATSIFGNVELFEINSPNTRAGGSFILTERFP
ncbi:FecR family protein [Alteromonas facilis]|uniref:FecR family protein n=1 Tax=Alteromonas facilis TaxID=2048004 RepID=UPI000C2823A3|nr:FecR family protein [Alteromonas facilis]